MGQLRHADAALSERPALRDRNLDDSVREAPQHTGCDLEIAEVFAYRSVPLAGGESLHHNVMDTVTGLQGQSFLLRWVFAVGYV